MCDAEHRKGELCSYGLSKIYIQKIIKKNNKNFFEPFPIVKFKWLDQFWRSVTFNKSNIKLKVGLTCTGVIFNTSNTELKIDFTCTGVIFNKSNKRLKIDFTYKVLPPPRPLLMCYSTFTPRGIRGIFFRGGKVIFPNLLGMKYDFSK